MTEHVDTQVLDRDEAREAVLADAVAVIDAALGKLTERDLVSSTEFADLLLDLRTLLTTADG